ncbi:uncharacterized protein LOC110989374 [Acanthaster planci]|uniref:Uncharacterized protein LOC110989374 n=1 Tax=Acanthaster planci TaxID=133434 RepID=A0A8B7ZV16_ACAPL|nr:uncharacterized protein LOC110989374 [Acanthaster planci]
MGAMVTMMAVVAGETVITRIPNDRYDDNAGHHDKSDNEGHNEKEVIMPKSPPYDDDIGYDSCDDISKLMSRQRKQQWQWRKRDDSFESRSASQNHCCPSCTLQAITPLNVDQIQQIRSNQALIQQIKSKPMLVYDPAYQRSVVDLTLQQQFQIRRNIPHLFMSVDDFKKSNVTRGRITVPGEEMRNRRKRQAIGTRVCQPVPRVNPLILATTVDGEVVEIIQMPGQGMNQWILEETCDNAASTPPSTLTCGLAERHVPAAFISVSTEPYIFDLAYVVVQSCVSLHG